MFVCFEGIDASGKATHSRMLAQRLGARLFSFPDYDTPMGRLIKSHLLNEWHAVKDGTPDQALNAMVFQALQLANRMEHAPELERLLAQGDDVVADRYWPSGIVYGGADGIDTEYMVQIQSYPPPADLYLLLDIDPDMSASRRPDRRDRYEKQAGLMYEVAGRYRSLWHQMQLKQGRRRWVVIDGRGTVEQTAAAVKTAYEGAVIDYATVQVG